MSAQKKLLVVDDHAMFREGLRSILSGTKDITIVGEATRGEQACKIASELRPELVTMDISLPDMSGIDATRRIKGILPNALVIILSMYSKAAYIVEAFRVGACGYVTKASTGTHLKECIETVLNGTYYLDPTLSKDIVQKILIQNGEPAEGADPFCGSLTAREKEIVRLIAEGLSLKKIAERLFISRKTAENHRANIYAKLGIHSSIELVRRAAKLGIIDIDIWKA